MSLPEALVIALAGMLIVMIELAMLAVIIIIMSKIIRAAGAKKADQTQAQAPQTIPEPPAAAPVQSAQTLSGGSLNLNNVDDKTAAMLMAIVGEETGIPLNEIQFKSIKALD